MSEERQYAPKDAARVTGATRRTILAAIARRELSAARYNSRVLLISESSLLAWRLTKLTDEAHNSAQLAQLGTTLDGKARRRGAR